MDILSRIHHALQIHQGQLVFPYFDFVPDVSNCVHRTNILTQLFAYCVCRFVVFKGEHVSDWSNCNRCFQSEGALLFPACLVAKFNIQQINYLSII